MHKRLILRRILAAAPICAPLTALAQPHDGSSAVALRAHAAQTSRVSALATEHTGSVRPANPAPPATIEVHTAGQVLLPDGKPAANARVYVSWMDQIGASRYVKTTTDANGNFTKVVDVPGQGFNNVIGVAALVPGKGMAWQRLASNDTGPTLLKLRLDPGITLEGRLVRPNGIPAAHVGIRLGTMQTRTSSMMSAQGSLEQQTKTPTLQAMAQQILVRGGQMIVSQPPVVPQEEVASLCHATTDAGGKFLLSGVPRQTNVLLQPENNLALEAGSAANVSVGADTHQYAGIFVATETGKIQVQVTDPVTGKPAENVWVSVTPTTPALNAGLVPLQQATHISLSHTTDKNGEFSPGELLPGDYQVNVQGCVRTVHVEAGHTAAPILMRVHQGPLQGRLLDPEGKPLANVQVQMSAANTGFGQAVMFQGGGFGGGFDSFNIRNTVVVDSLQTTVTLDRLTLLNEAGFAANTQPESAQAIASLGNVSPSMSVARTAADGTFTIPQFPWGSPQIRIRAAHGNDLAEWSGPADKILDKLDKNENKTGQSGDGTLKLQMQKDVLVSVCGRLLDPQRRPMTQVACQTLHWQPTPRATWFATAHNLQTDAQGNFRVDGLERNESFSIIAAANRFASNNAVFFEQDGRTGRLQGDRNRTVTVINGVRTLELTQGAAAPATSSIVPQQLPEVLVEHKSIPLVRDFESPRFRTCGLADARSISTGSADGKTVQNLGDVIVHPQDSPEEVMQSYGVQSFGDKPPVELPGVVAAPSEDAVKEAKQVLARYADALKAGNLNAVHQLTAHVSPGWSADRSAFLQYATLCSRNVPDGDALETRPLRYVPRSTVAALLHAAPAAEQARSGDVEEGDGTLNRHGNWIVLTRRQENTINVAGILHREDGQWRVVANSNFTQAPAQILLQNQVILANVNQNAIPFTPASFLQPVSPMGQELAAQALQAAEKFVQVWRAEDKEQLRAQTSPHASFFASSPEQFQARLEKRSDGGVCPLATGEKLDLQPVDRLTEWEQSWLVALAQPQNDGVVRTVFVSQSTAQVSQQGSRVESVPANPAASRMVAFRYSAQGHDFLMVLTHQNGQWKMLEPALPM